MSHQRHISIQTLDTTYSTSDTSSNSTPSDENIVINTRRWTQRTDSFFTESFPTTQDSTTPGAHVDDLKLRLSQIHSSNDRIHHREQFSEAPDLEMSFDDANFQPQLGPRFPAEQRQIAVKKSIDDEASYSLSPSTVRDKNSTSLISHDGSFHALTGASPNNPNLRTASSQTAISGTPVEDLDPDAFPTPLVYTTSHSGSIEQSTSGSDLQKHDDSEGSSDVYDRSAIRTRKSTADPRSRDSCRTVSTSLLVDERGTENIIRESHEEEEQIQRSTNPRTSSYYPPLDSSLDPPVVIKDASLEPPLILGTQNRYSGIASFDDSYLDYKDTLNPQIEHAVKLFKMEMKNPQTVELVKQDQVKDSSEDQEFVPPQKSVTEKKSHSSLRSAHSDQISHYSQTRKTTKGFHNASLLSSILVPPPKSPKKKSAKSKSIPALRKVSGSSKNETHNSNQQQKCENLENDEKHTVERNVQNLQKPQPLKSTRNSLKHQDTLAKIYDFREQMCYQNKDLEAIPFQHTESSSVASSKSKLGILNHIFSVPRIVILILVCMLVPPLFLMIGLGPRCGVPDSQIMRLIMNQEYRLGSFKGYIWDIDVTWFRKLCLFLGTLEVLIIFACIGIGFGVGLRN